MQALRRVNLTKQVSLPFCHHILTYAMTVIHFDKLLRLPHSFDFIIIDFFLIFENFDASSNQTFSPFLFLLRSDHGRDIYVTLSIAIMIIEFLLTNLRQLMIRCLSELLA